MQPWNFYAPLPVRALSFTIVSRSVFNKIGKIAHLRHVPRNLCEITLFKYLVFRRAEPLVSSHNVTHRDLRTEYTYISCERYNIDPRLKIDKARGDSGDVGHTQRTSLSVIFSIFHLVWLDAFVVRERAGDSE